MFECGTIRAIATRLSDDGKRTERCEDSRWVEERVTASPAHSARSSLTTLLHGVVARWPGGVASSGSQSRLLCASADAIAPLPSSRWVTSEVVDGCHLAERSAHPHISHAGRLLHADRFDCRAFALLPPEAAAMDPQQRILLESGYGALACANHRRAALMGSGVAVYVGLMNADHASAIAHTVRSAGPLPRLSAYAATASAPSIASGRLSFALGLQGPCASVDTACSSGLMALATAAQCAQAMRSPVPLSGVALVGAASLILSLCTSECFAAASMLSADGRCKTFDERANGYVRGEAVSTLTAAFAPSSAPSAASSELAGCGVQQDGRSASLTAPSGAAQRSLIANVRSHICAEARRSTEDEAVQFVEAHGTGTKLGDPTEAAALAGAPCTQTCAALLAGTKASVGHAEPAAGLIGVARTILSLVGSDYAASARLRVTNPVLLHSLQRGGLAICTQNAPVTSDTHGVDPKRLGSVSSFGYSGTIAHMSLWTLTCTSDGETGAIRPPARWGSVPVAWQRASFLWDPHMHPLLQQGPWSMLGAASSVPSAPLAQYRSPVSGIFYAILSDHIVLGRPICPATAFVEMARSSATALVHATASYSDFAETCGPSAATSACTLYALLFVAPLVLSTVIKVPNAQAAATPGGPSHQDSHVRHVQLTMRHGTFEVTCGGPEGGDSTMHCVGEWAAAGAHSPNASAPTSPVAADAIRPEQANGRTLETLSRAETYTLLRSVGLEYGPSYRIIEHVVRWGADGARCRTAQLQRAGVRACEWWHPARLDAAFQACVLPESAELRLPFRVEAVVLPRLASSISQALVEPQRAESGGDPSVHVILSKDTRRGLTIRRRRPAPAVGQLTSFASRRFIGPSHTKLLDELATSATKQYPHTYETLWLPSEFGSPSQQAGSSCEDLGYFLLAPCRSAATTAKLISSGDWVGHGAMLIAPSLSPLDAVPVLEILVHLLQTLRPDQSTPPLRLITQGTQAGSSAMNACSCVDGGIWGLIRAARLETQGVAMRCIDWSHAAAYDRLHADAIPVAIPIAIHDPEAAPSQDPQLRLLDPQESEVACAANSCHAPRLVLLPSMWQAPFRLGIHERGSISHLVFEAQALPEHPPPEGSMDVAICAAGLNFRDVLDALGLYPQPEGQPFAPGDDCAGVLQAATDCHGSSEGDGPLRPGLRLYGSPGFAAGCSTFASYVRACAGLLAPLPTAITFEEACTLPTTFSTVHTALERMGRQGGVALIVHASTGGVGLCANENLLWLRMSTLATTSRPPKHRLLRKLNLPDICSSRDAASFACGAATAACTLRVSATLNSLSADFISSSFALTSEGGCFLEIGKRGAWYSGRMAASGRHVQLHVLDIAALAPSNPHWFYHVLCTLSERVNASAVHPLPVQVFDLRGQVYHAYRYLQSGDSVGKLVFHLTRGSADGKAFHGSMLLIGGLGGLGLLTARYLVYQGACRVVLGSRSGAVQSGSEADLQKIEHDCPDTTRVQLDASSTSQMRALACSMCLCGAPLQGLFHAAGVLGDGTLANQSASQLMRVVGPKAVGAMHLHLAFSLHQLRMFSVFASVVGLLGNAGQAPYAAANSWLDALSVFRRANGVAAQSTQWGYVAEVGMAARCQVTEHAQRRGFGVVGRRAAEVALSVAHYACRPACLAIIPADWSALAAHHAQRPSLLLPSARQLSEGRQPVGNSLQASVHLETRQWRKAEGGLVTGTAQPGVGLAAILELMQNVMGLTVPADAPLMDAGVDSLSAIELRNALQRAVSSNATLPTTVVFDHPSARLLARFCASVGQESVQCHGSIRTPSLPSETLQADSHLALVGASLGWPGGITVIERALKVMRCTRVMVRDAPSQRWDKRRLGIEGKHASLGAFMWGAEHFDNARFGIVRAEGVATDPQHRLLLEYSYEALHAAGERRTTLDESLLSVYVAICHEDFKTLTQDGNALRSPYASIGYAHSIASGRLSFTFGMQGTCVSVDTACSSALVGLHAAGLTLQMESAPAALTACVNLMLTPEVATRFVHAGMLSRLGRCHAFDERADGFARAEACSASVMRPHHLDISSDVIKARSMLVRQDGRSASLTAPNGQAQQHLLTATLRIAGASAAELQSIECHGTGTALGDPIEVGALRGALAPPMADTPSTLSGVKGNIGHGESAAGLSGLHALLLAHQHSSTAPNAQLRVLNPHVCGSARSHVGFALPVQLASSSACALGGVSSFGYSGTIAHLVLHERAGSTRCPESLHADNGVTFLLFSRRHFPWSGCTERSIRAVPPLVLKARSLAAEQSLDELVDEIVDAPAECDAVIVGAGLSGLVMAAALLSDGIGTVVFEKSAVIGGVWRHHANMFSRVNSSEPSYRIPVQREGGRVNTNHSYHYEILNDFRRLVEQAKLSRHIHTSREVVCISSATHERARQVSTCQRRTPVDDARFDTAAQLVILCTNRRLGRPRSYTLPGEVDFEGQMRRGLAGDVASLRWRGQRTLIIGMGAFAVESMRTALEHRASGAYFLCRRRGTVCPQIIDWAFFVRPRASADGWGHDAASNSQVMSSWQHAYDVAGATRPECWLDGLLKPDGHTVSVSDMFFVAHHLLLVGTSLGVAQCAEPHGIRTAAGRLMLAQIVIKCVGFELNQGNAELLQTQVMRGFGLVDRSLWALVEPHLDAGQFASPFGSSYLSGLRFQAKLVLRYWHQPQLEAQVLESIIPDASVNEFTSSDAYDALVNLSSVDPDVGNLLRAHLAELKHECEETLAFIDYINLNRRQWRKIHQFLSSSAGNVLKYPFNGLRSLIDADAKDGSSSLQRQSRQSVLSAHQATAATCIAVDEVLALLGTVLGAGDNAITADAPLMEIGLESLRAVELRDQLQTLTSGLEELPASIAFDHPTARSLASALSGQQSIPLSPECCSCVALTHEICLRAPTVRGSQKVEGRRCLGRLCALGGDVIGVIPHSRWNASIADTLGDSRMKYGGTMDAVDFFDSSRFSVPAAEGRTMDPQQRLLLEYGYESLHGDGWHRRNLSDTLIGVFVGIQALDHLHVTLSLGTSHLSAYSASGGSHSIASGRLSYVLHLQGPSAAYDTACSATLVAGHAALRGLQNFESTASLALGVNVILLPSVHGLMAAAAMTSQTGRCRSFDRSANGYARSEGIGAMSLRLATAQSAGGGWSWAGCAVRQDGARASLTAPNGLAQEGVMRRSLHDARLGAAQLTSIEAHGTGTSLGDPIEVHSVAVALLRGRVSDAATLALGTVKANAGHAEPLAGLFGLQAAILAAGNKTASPNAHLRVVNPFVRSSLCATGAASCILSACLGHLRLRSSDAVIGLGVSSFGYSGTIAHAVLRLAEASSMATYLCAADALIYRRQRVIMSTPTVVRSRGHLLVTTRGTVTLYEAVWTALVHGVAVPTRQPTHSRAGSLVVLEKGESAALSASCRGVLGQQDANWHCLRAGSLAEESLSNRPCWASPLPTTLSVAYLVSRGAVSAHGGGAVLLAVLHHCLCLEAPPTVWLLTFDAQRRPRPMAAPPATAGAAHGGLWGLLGSVAIEHPTPLCYAATDLALAPTPRVDIIQLAAEASERSRPGSFEPVADLQRLAFASRLRAVCVCAADHLPDVPSSPARSSHIITGGLSGLGMLAAKHLVSDRTKQLVLASRRGSFSRHDQPFVASVAWAMHTSACDVTQAEEAKLLTFSCLGIGMPMQGLLHAAGTTSDRLLRNTSRCHIVEVLAPKACAAGSLRAIASQCASLSSVIFISSVTGALGNAGQANYAVANGALDQLAAATRVAGRHAKSLQPLPVVGYGAGDDKTVQRIEAELGGSFHLSPDAFIGWLKSALSTTTTPLLPHIQLAVPAMALPTLETIPGRSLLLELAASKTTDPVPPAESIAPSEQSTPRVNAIRGAELHAVLLEEVQEFVESRDAMPLDTPLVQIGLDSLSALELRARIEVRTGIRLRNVDMLSNPTLFAIARLIEAAQADTPQTGLASRPWANSSVVLRLALPPPSRLPLPIAFLLCSPRSGSSLLQLCLNANGALYAGQELFLLPFETLGERRRCLQGSGFDEGLVKNMMELRGCSYGRASEIIDVEMGDDCSVWRMYQVLQELGLPRIVVDKTPPNAEQPAFLQRARELFCAARYIHLVRHPYACIASGIELARDALAAIATWADLESLWVQTNASVADFFAQVEGEAPTLVLKYEQLISDPQTTTREVCEVIGVAWESAMTDPYETDATRSFEAASSIAATDPKLLRHRTLEPRLADKWRDILLPQPLGVATKAIALSHRYELLAELPDGLEWLSRSHATTGAPPIVCVHDFTGGLWAFSLLAKLLHAPCLGISCRLRLLSGCETFHALASRYLQLLPANLWPEDTPVRIVGYSLGCRIAHRMACELESIGRSVKLILLDGPIGARAVGNAPRLAQLAAQPSDATPGSPSEATPEPLRRALEVAGDGARDIAVTLAALVDSDPSGSLGSAHPEVSTQTLYVAARAGHNRLNGTLQQAMYCRPRAHLLQVDGDHFSFLTQSAHELAQIINEFLLGATSLLG